MLFKILERSSWEAADGQLPWAPIDRADGFVHLSAADQVEETAARHFADRDDLVLVELDPKDFAPETLVWEPSRGGQDFPHVYGDIPLSAVRRVAPLSTRADARFPKELLLPE